MADKRERLRNAIMGRHRIAVPRRVAKTDVCVIAEGAVGVEKV